MEGGRQRSLQRARRTQEISGMSFWAGVDVVLVDEDTGAAEWQRWPLEGQDAFDRARSVRLAMPGRGWWEDHSVIALAIEEPAGHNTRPLNRVQGAILARLPASLLVHPLRPSEWRKLVGLPGNASKAAVAERAKRTAGVTFPKGRRFGPGEE